MVVAVTAGVCRYQHLVMMSLDSLMKDDWLDHQPGAWIFVGLIRLDWQASPASTINGTRFGDDRKMMKSVYPR